jgi:hypothetical protein
MIETTEDLSTPQLLQRLTEQTATLARQEIHLAQLELTTKAKRAGMGIGALGAAGMLAVYGLGVLLASAVLGLSTVVSGWLAALIVAGALVLAAGVLALVGKSQVSKAVPPTPEAAIASTREDLAVIKKAAHR